MKLESCSIFDFCFVDDGLGLWGSMEPWYRFLLSRPRLIFKLNSWLLTGENATGATWTFAGICWLMLESHLSWPSLLNAFLLLLFQEVPPSTLTFVSGFSTPAPSSPDTRSCWSYMLTNFYVLSCCRSCSLISPASAPTISTRSSSSPACLSRVRDSLNLVLNWWTAYSSTVRRPTALTTSGSRTAGDSLECFGRSRFAVLLLGDRMGMFSGFFLLASMSL